jgi:predicted aspartyl protease
MRSLGCLALLITLSCSSVAAPTSSLRSFLESQGFCGSGLSRRFGNHLFANSTINGRRAALMIDSGCPITLIDRVSAQGFALRVHETRSHITGITGVAKRYGVSEIRSLAMGNCTFVNVPIEVAEASQINLIAQPSLDGLIGAHEMVRFGMIIDCARQMIYANPRGPSRVTSRQLASFLAARGFTRIPMRFNSDHHLEIDARVNGQLVRLGVDTGSLITLISARSSLVAPSSRWVRGMAIGQADLSLGNVTIRHAEVMVANVEKSIGAGLLGEEYLSTNFGIVDVGGLALYLRRPDAR